MCRDVFFDQSYSVQFWYGPKYEWVFWLAVGESLRNPSRQFWGRAVGSADVTFIKVYRIAQDSCYTSGRGFSLPFAKEMTPAQNRGDNHPLLYSERIPRLLLKFKAQKQLLKTLFDHELQVKFSKTRHTYLTLFRINFCVHSRCEMCIARFARNVK